MVVAPTSREAKRRPTCFYKYLQILSPWCRNTTHAASCWLELPPPARGIQQRWMDRHVETCELFFFQVLGYVLTPSSCPSKTEFIKQFTLFSWRGKVWAVKAPPATAIKTNVEPTCWDVSRIISAAFKIDVIAQGLLPTSTQKRPKPPTKTIGFRKVLAEKFWEIMPLLNPFITLGKVPRVGAISTRYTDHKKQNQPKLFSDQSLRKHRTTI